MANMSQTSIDQFFSPVSAEEARTANANLSLAEEAKTANTDSSSRNNDNSSQSNYPQIIT